MELSNPQKAIQWLEEHDFIYEPMGSCRIAAAYEGYLLPPGKPDEHAVASVSGRVLKLINECIEGWPAYHDRIKELLKNTPAD